LLVSFEVFDKDGSKSISREELYEFCYMAWTSAFRTLLASHSEVEIGPEEVQNFCKESATNFVNQVFDEIDVNHDGKITLKIFSSI
jgi:Ca2+-binding EF-hand superfamily protein